MWQQDFREHLEEYGSLFPARDRKNNNHTPSNDDDDDDSDDDGSVSPYDRCMDDGMASYDILHSLYCCGSVVAAAEG